jgi:hypothetical protein
MPRVYESKTWDVPLAGGVDEKSDTRYRNVPDVIRNCKYTKLGSLSKRPGSDCVNPFPNPMARQFGFPDAKLPALLASSERGLLRYGGGEVDLVDDNQTDALRFVGETSWVGLDRFSVGGRAQRDIDVATNGEGVWVGFCRTGEYNNADIVPYVVGLDPTTLKPNGIEYSVTGGGEGDRLKLATRGVNVWNIYRDFFTTLVFRTYDVATNTVGVPTTLDAAIGSNGAVDVWPEDPDALVIWGGTGGVRVARLRNSTGTAYQSLIFASADTVMSVSITRHPGTNTIGVAWWTYSGSTYTLRAATLNDTGAAFTVLAGGPFIITTVADSVAIARQVNIVGAAGTTNAFLVFESQDLLWDVPEWVRRPVVTVWFTINGNAAPDFPAWSMYDTQLISKARLRTDRGLDGPRAFIWLRSMTDAWSSNLLVGVNAPDNQNDFENPDFGPPFHVEAVTAVLERTPAWSFAATSNKQIARDDWPNLPNYTRTFTTAPDNTWITPFLMGGVYIPSPNVAAVFPGFEFSVELSVTQWQVNSENIEFYGNSALSGGTIWLYDGSSVREDGFFTAPPPPKLVAGTGGFLTGGFKYGYQIVYYSESGTGRASYSPTSTAIFTTLTVAQNMVTVTVPVPNVVSPGRDVVVEIYRTVKNGSTFFLVDRLTVNPNGINPLTYVDTKPDQAIEAARTIYTTGGVLEFETPPASEFVTFAQNRLWTIDDRGRVWFTDNIVDGEDPKFNTSFTIKQFSDEPLNAIAALDEKTILFTPNEIWVTYGDGPDGKGSGGFAALYKVASDVGCVSPGAITTTPWGVFFQSRDGLCLLNRGLEVTRIGKPIEDTSGQVFPNPTLLSSAVLVPKFSEVRFGVSDFFGAPDNSRSIGIVIDLFTGAPQKPVWYAYLWSNPFNPVSTISADATIYKNLYTWIDNNGRIFKDSLTHYFDRAAGQTDKWVTMEVQSSFVNMGESEQAFSRVWRAGFMYNLKTNVDVTLSTYVDYGSVLQTQTFQAGASQFFVDRRLMLRLKRQRVYATKATFTDAPPTGGPFANTGEGWQLAAVSFEGMVEGGMTRLPATQKR